jgi:hypothetical protein
MMAAKWSELGVDERIFVASEAVRLYEARGGLRSRESAPCALRELADEVCESARLRGILIPRRTMEIHVRKMLVRLARGVGRMPCGVSRR